MSKIIHVVVLACFTLTTQACCYKHGRADAVALMAAEPCSETQGVADGIKKRILALQMNPALTKEDVKLIIAPLGPHYGMIGICRKPFLDLVPVSLKVVVARSTDITPILTELCSQEEGDEVDRDVIAGVALLEERAAAKLALEHLKAPTDACL